MNTREQLNQYLRGLESRLRLQVLSKGIAVALEAEIMTHQGTSNLVRYFALNSTAVMMPMVF